MREYVDIRDCIALGAHEMNSVKICTGEGKEYSVGFSKQKTGYGEKAFFICPMCGKRREKLYILGGSLLCRECYPDSIYRNIKNVPVGSSSYLAHRMRSLAKKEGIIIKRFPFCYMEYEKPIYKHFEKWHMAITKLQAMENMRFQAIFLRKRYHHEVINSILEERNTFLFTLDLYDMDRYIYDWEAGYREFVGQ
ncbi:hypothetical protein [Blautia sp.]|uniref:hypothetical protein n=1 Tax=Blautia sp. TaxID=1955243 RepID=UPI002A8292DA|nr:hypothetical protein [Blautia sp.]MDY4404215.1 hypothetical protein [Blautia sp.]